MGDNKDKVYPLSEKGFEMVNREFVNLYNYKHWFFRIKSLTMLIENMDEFLEESEDEELEDEDSYSFELALKTEVMATFFHTSETLLTLLISYRDYSVPWVGMKNVMTWDLYNFVKDELREDEISEETLRKIFFFKVPEDDERLDESLDFVEGYLQEVGRVFMESDFYNEYKHGLRLNTSKTALSIVPETGDDTQPVMQDAYEGVTTLKEEKFDENEDSEFYSLVLDTESFNYERYVEMCWVNYTLIKNIFSPRKTLASKDEAGELEAEYHFFHKESIDDFFQDYPEDNRGFSHSYPVGEKRGVIVEK